MSMYVYVYACIAACLYYMSHQLNMYVASGSMSVSNDDEST